MTLTHLPANPSDVMAAMQRAVYLPPADLVDNPRNLRTEIGDLTDLKASMAVIGILCPLIVVPIEDDPERFQIIIGHRRKYAALELELAEVPCWIAADEGAALQIVAQLAENGHRVGLSATEEAEAYFQLTLLDWTPERIADVRAIPASTVKQSLRLRDLPAAARSAADTGVLTLDDAARMAEFADQPTAMDRIIKAAGQGGWNFQHAIAAERSKRDFTVAKERTKAELIVAGVKVTGKPKGFPYDGPAVAAKSLEDPDGNRLDPDVVKAMPGFAAYVEKLGDQARPVVYCVDPDRYGYTRVNYTHSGAALSPEKRAQAEAAHAELLAGLTVAESVRRDFYRQTYGSARAAKKLFAEALREVVRKNGSIRFQDVDGLYSALGGTAEADVVTTAGEDKLRRILVAQWICAHENNLHLITLDRGWGVDDDAAAWWFDHIVADGYTLSDAEATLRQQLDAPDEDDEDDAADAAENDGDDDDADEDNADEAGEGTEGDEEVDEILVDLDAGLADIAETESLTV